MFALGGSSRQKWSSMLEQISVWNGGSEIYKLCGLCTHKMGVKLPSFHQTCIRIQNVCEMGVVECLCVNQMTLKLCGMAVKFHTEIHTIRSV